MAKLTVGSQFPDFKFNTGYRTGLTVKEEVKKAEKTIFWVLRYIGCTTCRYDVHLLSQRYEEFKALGTQILVVMQSEPATVQEDLKDSPLPFEIICDVDQEIYKTLEIRATETREERQPTSPEDIAKWQAKIAAVKQSGFVHGKYEGNEQQLPAFFVTDNTGKVLYAHYAANSIDMPTVDEALEILKKL